MAVECSPIPEPTIGILISVVGWFALSLSSYGQETSYSDDAKDRAANPPNVVLVMTDDQGYGDLSCHGNPVLRTPAMDRLHAESVRMTDYHVSPTCSPTRAALLTGHWTDRTGVWHTIAGRSLLSSDETTLAELFREAGYATGMFGKWHLGDNFPMRPIDQGFDEVFYHGGGGMGQTPDFWNNSYFDATYNHNGHPEQAAGFCSDVFFDQAKQFIRNQASDSRPFFAYIAPNAAHGPMHSPPEYAQPYLDAGLDVKTANFFGMIANLDDNLTMLREDLKEQNLDRDTILIFTTDNGSAAGTNVFGASMRAAKGSEYDGGHRVPMFIHYPAAGMDRGIDIDQLTAHVDLVPTLADWCGLAIPDDVKLDGTSWAKLIRSSFPDHPNPLSAEETEFWRNRIVVTDSQRMMQPKKWKQTVVMTSNWRLVRGTELYDIKNDPMQKQNVASGHLEVVDRLTKFYDLWWQDVSSSFDEIPWIVVGHPATSAVQLTAHDWNSDSQIPWAQSVIRSAGGNRKPRGHWNIQTATEGTYRVSLRRWPVESAAKIRQALPAGDPAPGQRAFREAPGVAIKADRAVVRFANQDWTQEIPPNAEAAVFEIDWPVFEGPLEAEFDSDEGPIGAFYVTVEKR